MSSLACLCACRSFQANSGDVFVCGAMPVLVMPVFFLSCEKHLLIRFSGKVYALYAQTTFLTFQATFERESQRQP